MDYTRTFGEGNAAIQLTVFEQPLEHGLIGMLTLEQPKCLIILAQDDDIPADGSYSHACIKGDKEHGALVYMSKTLVARLRQGDRLPEMILLHEVGHYVQYCEQDDAAPQMKPEDESERRAAIDRGEVQQGELDADAFAAKYLGKETTAAALSDLKNLTLEQYSDTTKWDEESIHLAVKEIELRIERLTQ